MLLETGAQNAKLCRARGVSRGDGNIDRRQGMLVQAKGFSCERLMRLRDTAVPKVRVAMLKPNRG